MGQYSVDSKYGTLEVVTESIDDGWVAYVSGLPDDVTLPHDDGPVAFLEEEAIQRLVARIESS